METVKAGDPVRDPERDGVNKDLLIGIVGTLVLVAAMIGVFQYEAARGGGSSYTVTWTETADVAGPEESGTTQAGVTSPLELDIATLNVTSLTFELVWSDTDNQGQGAPDTFNVTVTSPTGENRSAEASDGRVTITFDGLAPMPGPLTFLAASEEEALARTARDASSTAAVGVWGVAIYLVEAPGILAPVGGAEVAPDGQNGWTLATRMTVYEPRVERG